jgi:hypothetical protein
VNKAKTTSHTDNKKPTFESRFFRHMLKKLLFGDPDVILTGDLVEVTASINSL